MSDKNSVEVQTNGKNYLIKSSWKPGNRIFNGIVNEKEVCMQVERTGRGFHVQHEGYKGEIRIISSLAAELLSRMPEKKLIDISKKLVSPKPGLLVSLEVNKGDTVKSGDALAVVEAMKMENQLFAESDGVVAEIFFSPGDSLDVGQIILEL